MRHVYEYDVFISYHRGGRILPAWVRTHFYPRLLELLDDQLDRQARIFFDENIGTGSKWPLELRDALQRARVLVPVCSPKYFLSEWCLAEWHSMAHREELTGMGARGLIYPVIFCDSENFPKYALERQMRDLKVWNQPYQQFQDTLEYLDFHREVERIAVDLVDLIDQAPEWRSNWPVHTPEPEPPRPSRLPRF